MIRLYANMVRKGQLSIDDVPKHMREDVEKVLADDKKNTK